MEKIVISATGLFTPPNSISNEELVKSFNQYVDLYNEKITDPNQKKLEYSTVEFIEKASGIKSRYVLEKEGILDPHRMAPNLKRREENEMSHQCEMSVKACQQAMQEAGKGPEDIGLLICACSNFERPYPAISIEIQKALGIEGMSFDLNVACSSATFGIKVAYDHLLSNPTKCALIVNPEICSAHLNFKERECHFIFGDACTATILEKTTAPQPGQYEILGTKLQTQFSSNIRNNFGFLCRHDKKSWEEAGTLFHQQGRKVFKEVVPLVANLITKHLQSLDISPQEVKKMWLHQANHHMNQFIFEKVVGKKPTADEAPSTLDTYANTSSAGSMIAFHLFKKQLNRDELGVICSFGAGYSAGNLVIKAY